MKSFAAARTGLLLLAAATLGYAAPVGGATAQDGAAVDRGQELARVLCADCHAVDPDDFNSPLPEAPAFDDLADWRETTENTLSVWLVSSHPNMPNLILDRRDAADITAYILSLKN